MEKKIRERVLLMPLAAVEVLVESIPEETDTMALEEVIRFSHNLVFEWQKVMVLAEGRLQAIREKSEK